MGEAKRKPRRLIERPQPRLIFVSNRWTRRWPSPRPPLEEITDLLLSEVRTSLSDKRRRPRPTFAYFFSRFVSYYNLSNDEASLLRTMASLFLLERNQL